MTSCSEFFADNLHSFIAPLISHACVKVVAFYYCESVNPGSMAYTRVSALVLLAFAGAIAQAQLNADQKSVLLTTHNERRSSVDASNMLQLVSSVTILSFVLLAHSGMEPSSGYQSSGRSRGLQHSQFNC